MMIGDLDEGNPRFPLILAGVFIHFVARMVFCPRYRVLLKRY